MLRAAQGARTGAARNQAQWAWAASLSIVSARPWVRDETRRDETKHACACAALRCDSKPSHASAGLGKLRLVAAFEQRPWTRHAHPHTTHHPPSPRDRSALPERVFDPRPPARVFWRALIARARLQQQARPQRAPPTRAASAPGRYSSTTSPIARAAHQLHLRARPAGAVATTAHLQLS